MRRTRTPLLLLVTILACAILYIVGTSGLEPLPPAPTLIPPTPYPTPTISITLHLDGWDPDARITIQRINLWRDYDNRSVGIAGIGYDGEQVKLRMRRGDGVLVEQIGGTIGWVSYWFIREYKGQQ